MLLQKAGKRRRRTGIVANRGGSSYSEKEAEIEGVRDRCNSNLCNLGCFEVRALYMESGGIANSSNSSQRARRTRAFIATGNRFRS